MSAMERIRTYPQGTQPRFADAKVGIETARESESGAVARLLVRTPAGNERVEVRAGDEIRLHDGSVLRIRAVRANAWNADDTLRERGSVSFEHVPAAESGTDR